MPSRTFIAALVAVAAVAVVVAALWLRRPSSAGGASRASDAVGAARSPGLSLHAPLTCRTLPSCTDGCSDGDCAAACARRLTAAARPAYDALQACVAPACAGGATAPCHAPSSFACKMCVLAHCASLATACMEH